VDTLSDSELRSKLLEFGFPVMPITGTTRKVMTKKLKLLLDNKSKINKDNRRSLGRYSSEDESDNEVKVNRKYKRQTMAAPLMQPPKPAKKLTKLDTPPESPSKREIKTTTTTTRTTKILKAAKDDFDTGSESDEVADNFAKVSTPSPTRLPSSFLSASSAAEAASDRISQIRSRLSQYNSAYERPLYTSSPAEELLKDKENTPFLSNFTKRLSQLSESPKSAYEYKSDIKENDVNGGTARNYLSSYRTTRGRPSTYDYKGANQMNIFKNNFVPFMVLIVAFLFFIIVGVVYLGIRSDTALDVSGKGDVNDYLIKKKLIFPIIFLIVPIFLK